MQAITSVPRFSAENESDPPPPEWVSESEQWPWWRRRFKHPSIQARMRIDAWNSLRALLNRPATTLRWGTSEAQGIFGNAVSRVDTFGDHGCSALNFDGWTLIDGRFRRMTVRSPYGPLTISATTENFVFDITEIDGISESKSSDRYFATVQDFGADFTTYKRTPVDANGLATMLAHGEVRIGNPGTSDSVGSRLWDGKLFLYNAGGSHHFAGAAYIAKQLNFHVPLRALHKAIALNPKAVRWLLSTFVLLAVPKALAAPTQVAKLTGSCFELSVPDCICRDATLLLIPHGNESTLRIVDALSGAGARDIGPWFSELLALQSDSLRRLKERFGDRIEYPSTFDE
ncbi:MULTISPECIES: DUF6685 family protein [unclassified Variovorax]|uniref:DUF6685 family protein n=1 Tax=unclassified Variovorax TaxID=663243 RepID=UPI0032E6E861